MGIHIRIQILVATYLVLYLTTNIRRGFEPDLVEVVTNLQGEEPDVNSDDDNGNTVRDEHPVERREAACDVVRLYDGEDGEERGEAHENAENDTTWKKRR